MDAEKDLMELVGRSLFVTVSHVEAGQSSNIVFSLGKPKRECNV